MQVVPAENRRPIARDLPAQGSDSVNGSRAAVCTLSVRARSGSEGPLDAQTVTVKRLPTFAVCLDGIRFKANTQIPLGVMISCPAPDGGITERLASSDSSKVNRGEVEVPAGSTWALTTLFWGARTGDVEVTGIVSGYLRDTAHLVVLTD